MDHLPDQQLDPQGNPEQERLQAGVFIEAQINALRQFSLPGEAGVNRFPHSAEMFAAQEYLIAVANAASVNHFRDTFGNLYFYLLPKPDQLHQTGRLVITGSHLDSVPHGGAYDGISGSLTAFWGLLQLNRQIDAGEITLHNPVVAVFYDNEESAVTGQPYEGSSAAVGALAADRLTIKPAAGPSSYRNQPIIDHIAAFNRRVNSADGTNLPTEAEAIAQALHDRAGLVDLFMSWGLPPLQIEQLHIVALETHIEQDSSLETARRGTPEQPIVGLVETVSSPLRETIRIRPTESTESIEATSEHREYLLHLDGRWDHSGGAAMSTRRDALVGTAQILQLIDNLILEGQVFHVIDIAPPDGQAFAQTKVPGGAVIHLLAEESSFNCLEKQIADRLKLQQLNLRVATAAPALSPYRPLTRDVLTVVAVTIQTIATEFSAIDSGQSSLAANMRATIGGLEIREDGGIDLRLDVRNAFSGANPRANRRLRRHVMQTIRNRLPGINGATVDFAAGNRSLVRRIRNSAPVHMSEQLTNQSAHHADSLSWRYQRQASYPGHDVANIVEHGVRFSGQGSPIPVEGHLAFVPSTGGSHNPAEYARPDDLGAMAVLNRQMMADLATTRTRRQGYFAGNDI